VQISGLGLDALREQYRRDLFDDYVPFWRTSGFDFELGGFMCAVDHDGTQVNTDKSMWYQARGLWYHSFLYNHFGGEEHLEIARKTCDFIVKHGRDQDGNWVQTMDRDGRTISPADKMGYAALFVAEGLQEYAKAAGDGESMDLAIESFWRWTKIYDDPTRDAPQGYIPVSYPGMRVQGFEMVTISLLSKLLEKTSTPQLEARLDHALEMVTERFWNPEYRLNNEALDHGYGRPSDENEYFVYLCHAIETFWIILREALRRRDQALFDLAANRFKRHLEVAWDDVHDGFFLSMEVNGSYTFDKVLWLQEEVLIGTMMLLEHTDLEWPEAWFGRTFRYVQEKFPLKQHGYPMFIMGGDRTVTYRSHTSRKGNYHHPRHLMLNLLAIDRMIERRGRLIDVWR
jgi:mannose/cellobiose epimerase-like protein (N-acyl-D-glucosamine 2-epimerase family)